MRNWVLRSVAVAAMAAACAACGQSQLTSKAQAAADETTSVTLSGCVTPGSGAQAACRVINGPGGKVYDVSAASGIATDKAVSLTGSDTGKVGSCMNATVLTDIKWNKGGLNCAAPKPFDYAGAAKAN